MTKESKDYGKSVKEKLLNLSKVEGLPYQPLLIRYVQGRLLYRLAQSKYKNRFYLKGGALLYAYEQLKARPTLDIVIQNVLFICKSFYMSSIVRQAVSIS